MARVRTRTAHSRAERVDRISKKARRRRRRKKNTRDTITYTAINWMRRRRRNRAQDIVQTFKDSQTRDKDIDRYVIIIVITIIIIRVYNLTMQ
jgi:IS5 family transposase